jgi:hypothetical protein
LSLRTECTAIAIDKELELVGFGPDEEKFQSLEISLA